MKLIETEHPEVFIVEPQVHGDHRGYFMETWSAREVERIGISAILCRITKALLLIRVRCADFVFSLIHCRRQSLSA